MLLPLKFSNKNCKSAENALGIWIFGCRYVHPGELWVSKQRVQKVMSQRSVGSCTPCTRANAFPACPYLGLFM